jgi:hypothetical protein
MTPAQLPYTSKLTGIFVTGSPIYPTSLKRTASTFSNSNLKIFKLPKSLSPKKSPDTFRNVPIFYDSMTVAATISILQRVARIVEGTCKVL